MANGIEGAGSRVRASLTLAGLLALAAVFLAPAIRTGYWSEDLYQSIMPRGGAVVHGGSLLGEVASHVKITLTIGRFFPLTPVLMTTVHHVFHGAWSYKVYVVANGVLDVLLFYFLARKLGGRRDYACFAACLTVGLIQYRVAVDQSFGFSAQVQLEISTLFASLLALMKHLESRKWGWLVASTLFYLASDLLYEVSYLLVLMHLILIVRAPGSSWGRRAWTAMPFLGVVGFCAFESILVRWLFPSGAYWQRTGFEPRAVALALVHQATAGLPLTYFAFDPLKIFPGPGRGSLLAWLFDARIALVALPAFGLSFLSLRKRDGDARDATAEAGAGARVGVGWGCLVILGLILAVFPSVMIAISPYHRDRIGPGVGWSPVLIQDYGVGLILSAGLWNLVVGVLGGGSRARWKCVAASALVGMLVGVTYRANLDVVRCFNARYGSEFYRESVGQSGGSHDGTRLLLESALAAGLMDEVPAGSVVQSANEYPFWYDAVFSRIFYAAHTGKAFHTMRPTAGGGLAVPDGYRVRDVLVGADSGYVVLSRGVRGPLAPEDQPPPGGLRLYVRHPDLARPGAAGLPFQVEGRGTPAIDGRGLRALKSGRDWAIYSLEGLEKPVAPESLRVVFNPTRTPREVAKEPSRTTR